MEVEAKRVPTIRWDGKQHPLVGAYAMRDGNRWSVFVVSRKLDGLHDGLDFGDGATPVTLRLPFMAAKKITLHKLSGDPRQSNREATNISLKTENIPVAALSAGRLVIDARTGGIERGMPPGSILLYVFDAVGS
jgi:hypothetical protein